VTRRFRDLPIRRKLLIMTLASSVSALVLASAGFLAWDVYQFQTALEREITTQATIVADNAAAAINFKNVPDATATLRSLAPSPRIRMACLYSSATGALFAAYERADDRCPAEPPEPAGFVWDRYESMVRVTDSETQVGTLLLQRDLRDMYARLRVAGTTVLGLLLLATGATFLIGGRIQQAITTPLLDLAETARAISSSRNYTLRAVPASGDEVGVVVHAFNDMLDRIDERTSELSRANAELEHEVEERRRVESERSAALERERDANRLKDEFLATLSHELRTPLNAVLGWTRVLRTTRVEAETQTRALESIERNARAQARLIEDLLEVSRIVTGKLRLQMAQVDLAAIIDAALEVVQPAAAAKRLTVTARVHVRPAMTSGDPDRLQQIVWNLLSNAVKFTPPNGHVSVTLERREEYVLSVADSGPGIDPRFLPFVFEPFRQADGSASREHGGLGLGLAIAKRLVELHGGTITARAGEGRGAIFEVTLPSVLPAGGPSVLAAGGEARGETRAPEPSPGGAPARKLLQDVHVLIVDDEEDARVLLQTALAGYGADVATAGNVADAMAAIERRPPDVLLSDIGMPHEDGYALIRRLRARPASAGGTIPAIAITAYASARDRREAEGSGYQAHIAKPFEPADVAQIVARLRQGV
jgi:signal transduction histidine kinase/ActR/RegA family two-component response regulator